MGCCASENKNNKKKKKEKSSRSKSYQENGQQEEFKHSQNQEQAKQDKKEVEQEAQKENQDDNNFLKVKRNQPIQKDQSDKAERLDKILKQLDSPRNPDQNIQLEQEQLKKRKSFTYIYQDGQLVQQVEEVQDFNQVRDKIDKQLATKKSEEINATEQNLKHSPRPPLPKKAQKIHRDVNFDNF